MFTRLAICIGLMISFHHSVEAEEQRKPLVSEQKLLRDATAQRINISRANFSFFLLPTSWKNGTFAYSFGIYPKHDRSKFDCVEAIIEIKRGRIFRIESVDFDDAKTCESARPK
jgi:hypothetical protein